MDEKREKLRAFIATMDTFPVNDNGDTLGGELKTYDREIEDMCYSLSEMGLLPDYADSISAEQFKLIVKAWYAIFEHGGFPKDLRM